VSDTIDIDELAARLGEPGLTVLDVRTEAEHTGTAGYRCDPRQGHIPDSRHLDVAVLAELTTEELREVIGLPPGAEIVAYCHVGSRSAFAADLLRAAGYRGRNYVGSWHEWSRRDDLDAEAQA
jgi:thiosulfate/3-mercaptopyruvate sulfurtransferase